MGEVRQVQFGGKVSSSIAAQDEGQGNVVDMSAFRSRKALSSDRKVSVGEAFSGISPKASTSSVNGSSKGDVELSDRIERIKNSINRINQLMADLKGASKDDQKK
jgi:hypothetical protein